MRRLHLGRSCTSSSDNPLSDKSFLMLSNHLCFGLPLLLFPGTSIPITLFPTYSSSLLETCPYHFNLLSYIQNNTIVSNLILNGKLSYSIVTSLLSCSNALPSIPWHTCSYQHQFQFNGKPCCANTIYSHFHSYNRPFFYTTE